MSLPDDLLKQAQQLATREPKHPKQASLRRAISAAYYALFHLLIESGATLVASGFGQGEPELRNRLRRGFQHGDMKQVAHSFRSNKLAAWQDVFGPQPPSNDLKTVADSFVNLLQSRHEADYNVSKAVVPSDVTTALRWANSAFQAWGRISASREARCFCFAMLFAGKKALRND